jgi:hypothetical protein
MATLQEATTTAEAAAAVVVAAAAAVPAPSVAPSVAPPATPPATASATVLRTSPEGATRTTKTTTTPTKAPVVKEQKRKRGHQEKKTPPKKLDTSRKRYEAKRAERGESYQRMKTFEERLEHLLAFKEEFGVRDVHHLMILDYSRHMLYTQSFLYFFIHTYLYPTVL